MEMIERRGGEREVRKACMDATWVSRDREIHRAVKERRCVCVCVCVCVKERGRERETEREKDSRTWGSCDHILIRRLRMPSCFTCFI